MAFEMYVKPVVKAHEPDPDLYETPEWQNFIIENSDINKRIQEFYKKKMISSDFGDNVACATTEEVAKAMEKPVHLIRQILAIWAASYTSFFQDYGRLFYHSKIKKWCYMDQNHPKSRMWYPY